MTQPATRLMLDRRRFLSLATAGVGLAGIGALGVAGCSSQTSGASGSTEKFDYIKPTDPEIAAAEAARASSGTTVACALAAAVGTVDLGGRLVNTWTYGSGAV
ncbi:MAG: multicopper oxidase family protein, partial [Rhodococcus sp. (in: high G+C Gram-positive bacteria)]